MTDINPFTVKKASLQNINNNIIIYLITIPLLGRIRKALLEIIRNILYILLYIYYFEVSNNETFD
jgi:hypothetical protein